MAETAPPPGYLSPYGYGYGYPQMQPTGMPIRPIPVPVYYGVQSVSVPMPTPRAAGLDIAPEPAPAIYADLPPIGDSPFSQLASLSLGERQSRVVAQGQSTPRPPPQQARSSVTQQLGFAARRQGCTAPRSHVARQRRPARRKPGGRSPDLCFQPAIAASLRNTSDVGGRGAEFAAGVRVQPLVSLPIWVTAERRQRLGQMSSGRNAWAVFAETGLYQRPMPGRSTSTPISRRVSSA